LSGIVRRHRAQPNERWQADTTHRRLADAAGETIGVENLNIDDHSAWPSAAMPGLPSPARTS